jgi:hypothetical protein
MFTVLLVLFLQVSLSRLEVLSVSLPSDGDSLRIKQPDYGYALDQHRTDTFP